MESTPNNQNHQNDNLNDEEKRERKRKIRLNKEEQRENIVTSGNLFIIAFKNLLVNAEARKEVMGHYMERVLHSIFFFGQINTPPILPEEFLPGRQEEQFRNIFPKPFSEYNNHLPHYTPYSILLEFLTESLKSKEDPHAFMEVLVALNTSLWKDHESQPIANDFAFTASVVTYCCVKDSDNAKVLKKAYGSSMSCKGKVQRKIMIAISALHVWDRAVSYAVCCAGKGPPITFPQQVHCNAYRFNTNREKGYENIPPCTKCNKMYRVDFNPEYHEHTRREDWEYGNCAENESFSRLLHSHRDVREEICIRDDNGEKLMNREDIENKFKDEYEDETRRTVRQLLTSRKFKLTKGEWRFFTPYYSVSSQV